MSDEQIRISDRSTQMRIVVRPSMGQSIFVAENQFADDVCNLSTPETTRDPKRSIGLGTE